MKSSRIRSLLFLAGVIPILILLGVWGIQEPREIREWHLSGTCDFSLHKIGKALLEYSAKDSASHEFPPDLEILLRRHYLPHKGLLSCGKNTSKPYYYFSRLRSDMPGNLPLLVEADYPHIYYDNNSGEVLQYGRYLTLDFTTYFVRQGKEDVAQLIQKGEQARQLMENNNHEYLLNQLELSTQSLAEGRVVDGVRNFLWDAAILWKLRQESDVSSLYRVKKYWAVLARTLASWERNFAPDIPVNRLPDYYREAQGAAREVAYLRWRWEKRDARQILARDLSHSNYFIRKNAWHLLSGSATLPFPELGFISPKICQDVRVDLEK